MAIDRPTRTPRSSVGSPSGPSESEALRATKRLVEALRDPACHPHATGPIRVLETHVSYILLTGSYAYKLKKPLRLDFLDFRSLESRRLACEDELRLNRRTAPDLYLRVVPIAGSPDRPRIDGPGPPIEYAVEMRQFDPEALLAKRVEAGEVDGALIDDLARSVADFHAGLGPCAAIRSPCAAARINLGEILSMDLSSALRARCDSISVSLEAMLVRLEPVFVEREREGFVRECHGDLHLANVALVDDRPVLFDGLEFDRALRTIDVIDEIAFVYMDLLANGRRDLGHRFVNTYLEQTGDYAGVACLRFYSIHRALVRAKVALIRARQLGLDGAAAARIAQEIERHVAVAEALAAPRNPRLVITCGLAGSGKTTVSGQLVELLPALRIRSDVERKRMAGLVAAAHSRSPIGEGLYDRESSLRTYARLAALAQAMLESGLSVIVDAAFLRRSEREPFRALAREEGIGLTTVICEAPIAVLRERVEARMARGIDASEADAAVLDHQLEIHERPAGDELEDLVVVRTDGLPAEVLIACHAIANRRA